MVPQRTATRLAGTWIVLAGLGCGALAAARYFDDRTPAGARPSPDASDDVATPARAELEDVAPRAELRGSLAANEAADDELGESDAARRRDRAATHERAAYLEFLAEEARAPGSLDARAAEILGGTEPAAVQLALLRARLECRTPRRLEGVLALVRPKTQTTTPLGESLAEAAVRLLGETAKEDPEARDMIRRIAFEAQPISSAVRVRAAQAFARSAVGRDLEALERHLAAETDSGLLAGALLGLAENPDGHGARRVAVQLGLSLPTLTEDLEQ